MAFSKRAAVVGSNNHSSRKNTRSAQAPDADSRRATRSMTTDASRKAVFNTNELLEQIILCLPMKNIFGIQRVCKQFRDVIAGSPKIQERMFLRLRNDVPKEAWVLETSVSTRVPWGEEPYLRKVDVNTGKRHYRPVALNPLLGLMSAEQRLSAADRLYRNEDQTEYAEMFLSRNHFGAHPSFLKTYITDPPCYTAQASITADFLLDPTDEDAFRGTVFGEEVTAKGGLTIGDLILARTSVELFWDTPGLGDAEYGDSQMEEVIDYTAPFVTGNTSSPRVQLQLQEVVIPTDEERKAVSSQHEKAAS